MQAATYVAANTTVGGRPLPEVVSDVEAWMRTMVDFSARGDVLGLFGLRTPKVRGVNLAALGGLQFNGDESEINDWLAKYDQ